MEQLPTPIFAPRTKSYTDVLFQKTREFKRWNEIDKTQSNQKLKMIMIFLHPYNGLEQAGTWKLLWNLVATITERNVKEIEKCLYLYQYLYLYLYYLAFDVEGAQAS